MEDVAKTDKTS
jgi:hypothetical protein